MLISKLLLLLDFLLEFALERLLLLYKLELLLRVDILLNQLAVQEDDHACDVVHVVLVLKEKGGD